MMGVGESGAAMSIDEAERRQREALDWVIRLLPGTATTADLEEFRRWSGRSPAHARAFAEARRLWQATAEAGRTVLEREGAPVLARREEARARRVGRRFVLGGALAGGVAAAGYLMVRPPFGLWPSLPEMLEADYRTVTGEQRRLVLADDVSVELNTQTSIALRADDGSAGRIELLSGEGAITTRARPFEVIAGPGLAQASTATFTIRWDGESVRVTCVSGAVDVICGRTRASVGAGQQVAYSAAGLGATVAVDPAVVTAWRSGFLVFHDAPLSEVIAEVNRYRRGRIVLVNAALGRRLVNARFRLDRIDDIVTKLTNAFGATATTLPAGVVILS
jgi:transmembrane sensor